jgi:excisionase family DNA binding protein
MSTKAPSRAPSAVPELWNYEQAARALGVSKRTLQTLVATGEVPYTTIGARSVRFVPAHLKRYVDDHTVWPDVDGEDWGWD